MPDTKPNKRFSLEGFDRTHYRRTQRYVNIIERLYDQAILDLSKLAVNLKVDENKPFTFDDYPRAKKLANEEFLRLANNITTVVQEGTREEWLYACKKNDEFLNSILNTSKVEKDLLERMQDRNLDALKTFQARKVNGMNLSQRVWKYTEQFKDQIELGIDVGIGEGRSAVQLSRDIRQNLNDPDRLFRRVRDKRGNLHLSKNAKAFNPGQGVYRSSAKNALRLTRTEINMAYRESDHLRWQRLDFVVGFEIKVSNRHHEWLEKFWNKHNPGKKEICDVLTGKYPKWFKFTGWHPQCMDYCIPILIDDETFRDNRVSRFKSALNLKEYKRYSSKNEVKDVPDAFKEWVNENKDAQGSWKSNPYFVRDNFNNGNLSEGLKVPIVDKVKPKPKPIAKSITNISDNLPKELHPKSAYLRKEDYTFDKEFFDLIDKADPIKLKITKNKQGSYYHPLEKTVYISNLARNERSNWERKAVVYHEFGHAIDWQRGLRKSVEIKELRSSQIEKLSKVGDYKIWRRVRTDNGIKLKKMPIKASRIAYVDHQLKNLSAKITFMRDDTFARRGISRHDVLEQIASTRNTIKSLFIKLGDGHSDRYFKQSGMQEAEYIAHAFENAYLGNKVFEKYLPDIYAEMISYIRSLK